MLKSRSLPILIVTFIVFMAVVSSPTVNLLSNNYLLYHYQAIAAKGRAHVMNDNKDDNSVKYTAANTPVICPDGSEPTDSGKCNITIQDKHPENPTISNDNGEAKDKSTHKSHSHSDPMSSPFDDNPITTITTDTQKKDNSDNNKDDTTTNDDSNTYADKKM